MPALIGGSEQCAVAHKSGKVLVDDAVSVLDGIVARKDVFRIVVPDFDQWRVFAVFRLAACGHRHAGLHVGVFRVSASKDEVAFEFSDASDTCRVSVSAGVCEDDVFKDGPVVDSRVGIGGEIKSEVGEVVFLFSADGSAGFEVEPVAFAKNLRVLENLDVAVEGFALDFRAVLVESFKDVRKTCRCAEIIDKVRLDFFEDGKVSDFYTALDVFFKNLGDDAVDVGSAVFGGIILYGFGKSAFAKIPVEFFHKVAGDRFLEERLHAEVFVKGEREHLEFKVASCQFCGKFSAKEIRIGAGEKNGMTAFFAEGIDDFFKTCHILDFIDEKVCYAVVRRVFVDKLLKTVRSFYGSVGSAIKIKIDNMRFVYAVSSKFICNSRHQTGFSATTDTGYDFYDVGVVVKTSDFVKVCLSLEVIHVRKYSKAEVKTQVNGVDFGIISKVAPLPSMNVQVSFL